MSLLETMERMEMLYADGTIPRVPIDKVVYLVSYTKKGPVPIIVDTENRKSISMWRGIIYFDTLEDADECFHAMTHNGDVVDYSHHCIEKYGNPICKLLTEGTI